MFTPVPFWRVQRCVSLGASYSGVNPRRGHLPIPGADEHPAAPVHLSEPAKNAGARAHAAVGELAEDRQDPSIALLKVGRAIIGW